MKAKVNGSVTLEIPIEEAKRIRDVLGSRSVANMEKAGITKNDAELLFGIYGAIDKAFGEFGEEK